MRPPGPTQDELKAPSADEVLGLQELLARSAALSGQLVTEMRRWQPQWDDPEQWEAEVLATTRKTFDKYGTVGEEIHFLHLAEARDQPVLLVVTRIAPGKTLGVERLQLREVASTAFASSVVSVEESGGHVHVGFEDPEREPTFVYWRAPIVRDFTARDCKPYLGDWTCVEQFDLAPAQRVLPSELYKKKR